MTPVRVMLVEDSLVVRELLRHIVSRDPRLELVAAVASGEEALDKLRTVRPDVISMDIRLPGIDGLETTRRIMAELPTPIAVVADFMATAPLASSSASLTSSLHWARSSLKCAASSASFGFSPSAAAQTPVPSSPTAAR